MSCFKYYKVSILSFLLLFIEYPLCSSTIGKQIKEGQITGGGAEELVWVEMDHHNSFYLKKHDQLTL